MKPSSRTDTLARSAGEAAPPDLLDQLVERAAPSARLDGIVVGRVTGLGEAVGLLVDFERNPLGEATAARSLAAPGTLAPGCEVALMFEDGDPRRPIVLGRMQSRESALPAEPLGIVADGTRVVIAAEREIELRCGDASLTLRRDGKVVVRGTNILSRSSGVQRIKGGSVQIN